MWKLSARQVLFLALAVLAGWYFRGAVRAMVASYSYPVEDMQHGWLVPFVSAWALWAERKRLAAAAGRPSWGGLAMMVPLLAMAWFGGRGGQDRMNFLALAGLVWAAPGAVWGWGVGRLMAFPAGFLVFMVPMSSFLVGVLVPLRLLCTWLTVVLLNGFGFAIERMGTALVCHAPGHEFSVDVAEACSGIRSLAALTALMGAYAYFTRMGARRGWALVALAVPVAVAGNVARLVIVCLVARYAGEAYAVQQPYHGWYGFVTYAVGVALMLAAAKALRGGRKPEAPAAAARPARGGAAVPWVAAALMAAVLGSGAAIGPAVYDERTFVAAALPASMPGYSGEEMWFCQDEACGASVGEAELKRRGAGRKCPACGGRLDRISVGERRNLPEDTTILKRNYTAFDGYEYSVNVVVSGRSRGSIHRPELCLPAQGFQILKAERRRFRVRGGRPRECMVVTALASHSARRFSLAYWFVSRDRECCSHVERIALDIWDRSVHNRINRWVMIAVNSSAPLDDPEAAAAFERFAGEFCPAVLAEGK